MQFSVPKRPSKRSLPRVTEIMCFPSRRLPTEMDGRNPKSPGPLGKVVPAVPGSSRNCKIQGVSSVLASLRIEPGAFIALVGESGSGKSTLLRLLLGFERPQRGGIFYDGQNLKDLDLRALRRQIGVVLQTGHFMPGSIAENILGATSGRLEDAWEAARRAGLAEDIEQMPMGMDTILTDGASGLSGGQTQRLLIARALASKPRILMLDEATSALDNRTQALVTESLERMKLTRIVVAHRLSTIAKADLIYVLAGGRIAQSGSYKDLITRPGMFADLARRQVMQRCDS